MTLDLTNGGSLSLKVDDKPSVYVFQNMKKGNVVSALYGFVPMASVSFARIEFLGFV